uniref:RAMA domain-containing protein n=1 Tax=Dunaliella tertiolecta TaxID=3047 RepID=A0A7S3QN35_DUNTE
MDSKTGLPISLLSALKGLPYAFPGAGQPASQGVEAQDKNKNVTLKELLDAGLINPGEGNVTLSYRGVTYTANLLASGLIEFQGATFDTPDAFSLRAKQLQLPDRESDNGWRSVLVDGVVLEDVRYSYLKGKRETAKVCSKCGRCQRRLQLSHIPYFVT